MILRKKKKRLGSAAKNLRKTEALERNRRRKELRGTILDTDLFCLWEATLEFLLPRLKAFREWHGDYPSCFGDDQGFEEWNRVLDEIIWFVEVAIQTHNSPESKDFVRYWAARDLLSRYFFHLWG